MTKLYEHANKNSSTGIRGLYLHKKTGLYLAKIQHRKKLHWQYFKQRADAEEWLVSKRAELRNF